jgi:hypothetical protein
MYREAVISSLHTGRIGRLQAVIGLCNNTIAHCSAICYAAFCRAIGNLRSHASLLNKERRMSGEEKVRQQREKQEEKEEKTWDKKWRCDPLSAAV